MLLPIFLHFAYVYNEIFTCPNGIFTRLGRVDIDFFFTSGLVPVNFTHILQNYFPGTGAWVRD